VHSRLAWQIAQEGVVGPGDAPQEIGKRQRDRGNDPPQHPEGDDGNRVASASASSLRRNRAIRRSSPMSIILVAAYTTTAPNPAHGNAARIGRPKAIVSAMTAAMTSE
jgi:hypothetical protein